MKMEQPINAHKAGTITGLSAEAGAVVTSGAVICEIKELTVPLGRSQLASHIACP